MIFTLKDYQFIASAEVTRFLRRATRMYEEDQNDLWSVVLSAPTGAGKTVIASSVIETLFTGSPAFPADPQAVVLWVTDDPALNVQTQRNMNLASSTLGPGRMKTITSSFDQEAFLPGIVYFLNIQKLAKSNPLSRANAEGRYFSLWRTIANTITASGAHFYVVIDEAHRGMKVDSDRQSIVSRIINGQDGINLPAPIVWGISATPERFNEAMAMKGYQRTHNAVVIPVEDVRSSGLLKNKIVLDNPTAGQLQGDTSFIRAGAAQTIKFEEAWRTYAQSQNEPPVRPAMVIQVPNTPSEPEMAEFLNAIFDSWEGLKDLNVVNTFGDHAAISSGAHTIRYMAPQDIQDDQDVRVVLCKDAISTGWDCPRAEVLVSLRAAQEYTYIAQLIGRMVRTPLARTITASDYGGLNDVFCYLPRFNRAQVKAIVNRFAEGKSDEPPVEMIENPVVIEHNEAVPSECFKILEGLPTYVVPGRVYRTQVSRLHSLATLLNGDHIVEDAITQTQLHLNGVLQAQRARLEANDKFQPSLARVRSVKVERQYVLLAAESLDDLPDVADYDVACDDNNIEDLFKVAKRKLPEGVATYYWNSVIDEQGDDIDPTEAKAITAVLALSPEVVEAVEAAAAQLTKTWLREHHRSISKLPEAKKALYEPVRRETREPEETEFTLQSSKIVADQDDKYPRHLLADEDGMFPTKLGGWEKKVVTSELKDDDLVGWYRNPAGGRDSIRIPYRGTRHDKSMYPDFVFFHQSDQGIKVSIVDPHGFHLDDALPKLKGLADYARVHGMKFDRIDAVVEIDHKLKSLSLQSGTVREAIDKLTDGGVRELFESLGGGYS